VICAPYPVEVGPADLDRPAGPREALRHDQGDPLLAGEDVEQLDLDLGPVRPGQGGPQVILGGGPAAVRAGQRGAAGHVQDDVVGEEPEGAPQSPSCTVRR
jgi:hypothetical protein